jgi:hypothetical protein
MKAAWARSSVRVTTSVLGAEAFNDVVGRLRGATGALRTTTQERGFVWVSECPLAADAPIERQLGWATAEAEAVAENLDTVRTDVRLEVWLAAAVPAQRGFLCEKALIARLATAGADLVIDLYSWD